MVMNYQHMENKVADLEYEVELLKQKQNDPYLIVTGVPEIQQEDLQKITVDISKKINVNLDTMDILDTGV